MKNYFSLAARIVGLLVLLSGLRFLLTFVFILLSGEADSFILFYFFAIILFEFVVGGYLVRGAPLLVDYAFRQRAGENNYGSDE